MSYYQPMLAALLLLVPVPAFAGKIAAQNMRPFYSDAAFQACEKMKPEPIKAFKPKASNLDDCSGPDCDVHFEGDDDPATAEARAHKKVDWLRCLREFDQKEKGDAAFAKAQASTEPCAKEEAELQRQQRSTGMLSADAKQAYADCVKELQKKKLKGPKAPKPN